MLAVLPGVRTGASAHAECRIAEEARPFCVLEVGSEGIAVDQSANGVAVAGSTVRVEFTTLITRLNVDLGEITGTGDLDVITGTDKMNAFEGAIRDDARAPAALGAPSNFLLLCVTNITNLGKSPHAEIVSVVHPHRLAH